MKKLFTKIFATVLATMFFGTSFAFAQMGGGISTPAYWYLDGTTLKPVSSSWTVYLPIGGTADGAIIIDVDDDEAFHVRKDGDAGDILIVDTNNSEVEIGGNLILANGETLSNSVNGQITFAGVGATNNEDLTFDFETVADTIGISSSTSVADIDFGSIDLNTTGEASVEHLISTDDADVNDNLTVGDIIIDEAVGTIACSGATSCSILSDSDALTIGGVNGALNNENLVFDFETVANEVGIGTGTGVLDLNFGSIDLNTTGEGSFEHLISTDDLAVTDAITGASINIGATVVLVGTLDDDTMGTATDTSIATSESIKAYVDGLVGTLAPVGATYITQIADATLTNEQALGALATGMLKNTTTTGVLSIGVADTDYQQPITWGDGVQYSAPTASIDYNTTNLKITSNEIDTVQSIATTASPQFTNMTLGDNSDANFTLTFDSDTNDGVIEWDEDNDKFLMDNITATTFVGALTGNSSTATALAGDPTDCGANAFAQSIVANGNLTCASIADADVPDGITITSADSVEGTDLGTLTDTKVCTYDLAGTEIDCASDFTTDEVGTLTSGDLCINDGSSVNCTVNTITELETALDAENVLIETEIDASSELLALIDDETGTGLVVFGTSPTFTTGIDVTGGGDIDADGIDLDSGNFFAINNVTLLDATNLYTQYWEVDETPASDHTGEGRISSVTVDVNATGIGACLHLDTDGNYIEADADAIATAPCSAIAMEAGTGTKNVLTHGYFRDDTWNWTVGALIYLSTTDGGLTETPPAGASDVVQIIGIAISADVIRFEPNFLMSIISA
ncbi:MAG: hypothetical protein KKD44_27725 [Proteobacteria bacterium]|nr:hypothetical protein [Pseudomonadota bacterium]